jgi:hypothetical protein
MISISLISHAFGIAFTNSNLIKIGMTAFTALQCILARYLFNSTNPLTDAASPENKAKIRYSVTTSLVLQDKNHLWILI